MTEFGQCGVEKGKVVPVLNEALRYEDLWESGIIALREFISVLDGSVSSASPSGCFTEGEKPPVPIGLEAGWTPEPVLTLWSAEKLELAVNLTTAVQLVTMPIELSRFFNFFLISHRLEETLSSSKTHGK